MSSRRRDRVPEGGERLWRLNSTPTPHHPGPDPSPGSPRAQDPASQEGQGEGTAFIANLLSLSSSNPLRLGSGSLSFVHKLSHPSSSFIHPFPIQSATGHQPESVQHGLRQGFPEADLRALRHRQHPALHRRHRLWQLSGLTQRRARGSSARWLGQNYMTNFLLLSLTSRKAEL